MVKNKKKIEKRNKKETMDRINIGGVYTPETVVPTTVGGDDTPDNLKVKVQKKKTNWIKPKRNPTTVEARKLFGKALGLLLTTCMDNHLYQFGNKVRIQKQGGQ